MRSCSLSSTALPSSIRCDAWREREGVRRDESFFHRFVLTPLVVPVGRFLTRPGAGRRAVDADVYSQRMKQARTLYTSHVYCVTASEDDPFSASAYSTACGKDMARPSASAA